VAFDEAAETTICTCDIELTRGAAKSNAGAYDFTELQLECG
jgi:hypothetical protein